VNDIAAPATPPAARPAVAQAAAPASASAAAEPRNTDPKTVLIGLLAMVPQALLPLVLVAFGSGGLGLLVLVPALLAISLVGAFFSYIAWKRLTYTIGAQDIRVESGVLSRSARSVPYERIQDVSLEQKLLPRLFGLVSVKFETGAGGGEDLSLSYLTEERGEELRRLVRELRDEQENPGAGAPDAPARQTSAEEGVPLFAMGPSRLFTYGLFEFSLAVFAVLGALFQYVDTFADIEIWDPDIWQGLIERYGVDLTQLDRTLQIIGALTGLLALLVIGSLTGMIRVFAREWGFLLERTARGFRRRRGLFTRTDVVMPTHRVQGVKLGTGLIRYRFGWHSLSFVSLAQDMGASSHVVAPFAKLEEIAPIAEAAGFSLPGEDADWRRASERYLIDSALRDALFFLVPAAIAGIATSISAPEWTYAVVGLLLVLAGISAMLNVLAWRFQKHALDAKQIMSMRGVLSPRSQIATRLKLHSVEIAQGPIARLRGYATVHLGQAGGTFAIPGVPIERAREVRTRVMETIAATDFSQLESQRA
jgi:putative membrane protein